MTFGQEWEGRLRNVRFNNRYLTCRGGHVVGDPLATGPISRDQLVRGLASPLKFIASG